MAGPPQRRVASSSHPHNYSGASAPVRSSLLRLWEGPLQSGIWRQHSAPPCHRQPTLTYLFSYAADAHPSDCVTFTACAAALSNAISSLSAAAGAFGRSNCTLQFLLLVAPASAAGTIVHRHHRSTWTFRRCILGARLAAVRLSRGSATLLPPPPGPRTSITA